VQGFHQTYGKDFFETFAPVVGFDTLRLILGPAAWHSWPIRTMDFKQAYLNSNLEEDIYVKNPYGTTEKLEKALYGLKQAGLEWHKTLKNRILTRIRWRPSEHDSCLYIAKDMQTGRLAMMAVYVDDLLLTGSWTEELEEIQTHLLKKFEGAIDKDPNSYIGMELTRQQDGLYLHQTGYCRSVVESIYSGSVRRVPTPLDCGADLSSRTEPEEKLDLSRYPYRRAVGKLMYLAHMTRPDICNSVRELGRYMHDPCMRHWRAVEHLVRYLATYPSLGLLLSSCSPELGLELKGYSDTDLAGCKETRRSCVGYMILLGRTPITWSSKTERSILLSTAETEWTALAKGIRHGNYLLGISNDIGLDQGSMRWFCDNQAAIKNAKTPGYSGRTRFVDIKLKFTRQMCDSGQI
ncbi:MAG: hypothetical protein GY752_10420, partial [bacterium]|nr:hypothetical protein [bacterium]